MRCSCDTLLARSSVSSHRAVEAMCWVWPAAILFFQIVKLLAIKF